MCRVSKVPRFTGLQGLNGFICITGPRAGKFSRFQGLKDSEVFNGLKRFKGFTGRA